jgi:hypothetical protein
MSKAGKICNIVQYAIENIGLLISYLPLSYPSVDSFSIR